MDWFASIGSTGLYGILYLLCVVQIEILELLWIVLEQADWCCLADILCDVIFLFMFRNCSRITTPLNYNFLQIINDNDTSFVKAMGETPLLGKSLQIIYPILIIILIIFNAFDVYSRICKRIGLHKFQF